MFANKLNNHYPIGKQVTCYYQSDNPSDSKLHKGDARTYFIFSMVFFALAGAALIGWGITEMVKFCNGS